jgi:hypothetical protein
MKFKEVVLPNMPLRYAVERGEHAHESRWRSARDHCPEGTFGRYAQLLLSPCGITLDHAEPSTSHYYLDTTDGGKICLNKILQERT